MQKKNPRREERCRFLLSRAGSQASLEQSLPPTRQEKQQEANFCDHDGYRNHDECWAHGVSEGGPADIIIEGPNGCQA
ncbi:MAG TPA: hypothetical protein VEC13_03265 [Candidatus Paceibacterota bacterium]|nr:hypothetical protein [Candidatus Paceibacterota bacterium]